MRLCQISSSTRTEFPPHLGFNSPVVLEVYDMKNPVSDMVTISCSVDVRLDLENQPDCDSG